VSAVLLPMKDKSLVFNITGQYTRTELTFGDISVDK